MQHATAETVPGSIAACEKGKSHRSGYIFLGMVLAFSAWILSLPLMPTQDGPMHRYYVHALDSILTHQHTYDAYEIRHPFPPYATHYFSLLALSHLFSLDLAEEIFVVLMVVCFAYGLRYCARSLGPSGDTVSLFVAPLLLGWTVMMGFFNYSLGVGLLLWAAGLWQQARTRPWLWIAFVSVVCLLTVTHPIPLLILIALCTLDLLLRFFWQRGQVAANWPSIAAIVFLLFAFSFPAASIDRTRSASTFAAFGLHPQQLAKQIALFGLSPYYAASLRAWINLYRVSLYLVLAGSFLLGALSLRDALRARAQRKQTANLSQTFFLSALLLAALLTVLPDYVNGSGFFGTRMMVLVWVGLMAAAAGYRQLSARAETWLTAVAVLFALISLVTAEVYFRPIARDLHALEQESLPSARQGIVLLGPHLDDYARRARQVAFDPYAWAGALPFTRADDVILDSPWIDQKITPLQAVPGSPLLVDDIRMTEFSLTDPPFRPGASLPGSRQQQQFADSSVIIFAGDPAEIRAGIGSQLLPGQVDAIHCVSHTWYMVCFRNEAAPQGGSPAGGRAAQ
jgi:hypothetical protein